MNYTKSLLLLGLVIIGIGIFSVAISDNIKQEKIMKLVKSDYESIRGMDKETALRIWKENQQIREIAWREIRQGAKGLGNQSEQYGAYLQNPHQFLMSHLQYV